MLKYTYTFKKLLQFKYRIFRKFLFFETFLNVLIHFWFCFILTQARFWRRHLLFFFSLTIFQTFQPEDQNDQIYQDLGHNLENIDTTI